MRDFGILPSFAGVVVSDRYVNYYSKNWEHIAGHQACLAHILRDYQDAAETYPDAIWPVQAQRALRGLIGAWHAARDAGLPVIPADAADPLILEFRRAVRAGLATVPRIPGPKHATAQHPGRDLLEFCSETGREDAVLRFTADTTIWPTNNISERGVRPNKTQQKISGRFTSEDTTQDRPGIRSYIDTAANTDRTPSLSSARSSPETPGGHPQPGYRPDPSEQPEPPDITHRARGECLPTPLPADNELTHSKSATQCQDYIRGHAVGRILNDRSNHPAGHASYDPYCMHSSAANTAQDLAAARADLADR